MITYKHGSSVHKAVGNAYEIMGQSPTDEKIMDYYNNEVGRNIGEALRKNKDGIRALSEEELKTYLAFETSNAIQSKEAITDLKDKRIIDGMKNLPDNPFRIYTKEEIDSMSNEEFITNEKNIFKNIAEGKVLTQQQAQAQVQSGGLIWVDSYQRADGTEVKGYYRAR